MKSKPAQSGNFAVARALSVLSDMFGRRMYALRIDVQLLTISDVRSVQTL